MEYRKLSALWTVDDVGVDVSGSAGLVMLCAQLQEVSKLPLRVHKSGPEGALIAPLRAAKVDVEEVSDLDVGYATGQLIAAGNADPPALFHIGQPSLDKALAGAVLRTTANGAAVWSQRGSRIEITPLQAVTVAAGGVPQPTETDAFVSMVLGG